MQLTDMDMVRGAIANALAEGLDIYDLWLCAEHASTPESFDAAVNELTETITRRPGKAWINGGWVEIG